MAESARPTTLPLHALPDDIWHVLARFAEREVRSLCRRGRQLCGPWSLRGRASFLPRLTHFPTPLRGTACAAEAEGGADGADAADGADRSAPGAGWSGSRRGDRKASGTSAGTTDRRRRNGPRRSWCAVSDCGRRQISFLSVGGATREFYPYCERHICPNLRCEYDSFVVIGVLSV